MIDCPGASLRWWPDYLAPAEADALLARLRGEIAWEQHRIRLFGREVAAPRLSAWVGDPQARYRYSGTDFEPLPWTPALADLRRRLEADLATPFNSVLANLYRDGADSMGWHADNEPELGPAPCIASLSLGAPRRFLLRASDDAHRGELLLSHGSLLVMQGETQARYRHCVPKTRRAVGVRLNLTFRWILPVS